VNECVGYLVVVSAGEVEVGQGEECQGNNASYILASICGERPAPE
jgi:hypothetical protein